MRQVSRVNTAGFDRIELVQEKEGVYIFIFERSDSTFPERDYLADDLEDAHKWCEEDFGVPSNSWTV